MADVIITTLSNTGDFKLFSAFQPILTFCDEAGKAVEADFWALLIRYPYSRGVILVGDGRQLSPLTKAQQNNCFDSVIRQSLFTRLEENGFETVSLATQHRFNSQINALVSSCFYRNSLAAHVSCDAREEQRRVRAFNLKRFEKDSAVIFIDAQAGMADRLGSSSSRHNPINLVVVMDLVEHLLRAGFEPRAIGIICPYQAQYALYGKAIGRLQHRYAGLPLGELLRSKFDTFQGGERSIIVADLVVDGTPGFLTQPNRLNVALSRARDGLYIVGNIGAYERSRAPRKSALMKFVTHCKINGYDVTDSRDDFGEYDGVLSAALDAERSPAGPGSDDGSDEEAMLGGEVDRGDVGEKVAADDGDEPGGLEVGHADRPISGWTYEAEDVAW